MALPGHSPPRVFQGPGSPIRAMIGHGDAHLPPSMYGSSRSMLPPSPQHYSNRFQNGAGSAPPTALTSLQEPHAFPPPYKRPGSSMSISSMLGAEPERLAADPFINHTSRAVSQQSTSGMIPTYNNAMSPPQQLSKPGYLDYGYKPRSRTPDRTLFASSGSATRQRSASSGTLLQRPEQFGDSQPRSISITPGAKYNDQPPPSFALQTSPSLEQEERARRTSLSGILQRPSSPPQSGAHVIQPLDALQPQPVAPTPFGRVPPTNSPRQNGGGVYDTRPPALNGNHKIHHVSTPSIPRSQPQPLSMSPEIHRSNLNGTQNRGLTNVLNGSGTMPLDANPSSMTRQDSARSHSDKAMAGDNNKFRAYSPFASSFTSGNASGEAPGRKGSDELSQHRAILGLAAENKRGRYSPMPQAVQGAQAQTPVPDSGIKSERGRVFSGIGSGIGSTPTSGPLSSSPFKRDGGTSRLSEDNLKNFSRVTSGTKRSRKVRGEDTHADSDTVNGEKPQGGARKRNKQQHSYNVDPDESTLPGRLVRRNTPMSTPNLGGRTATPTNIALLEGRGPSQPFDQPDVPSVVKPTKTIRVASVFGSASKNSRHHLGSFTYRPNITSLDRSRSSRSKFDVSITPNLIPSFTDPTQVNCTYTIHVPRIWLQQREKSLICLEQHLWGSGIYTDDSDPVAAAMHAGFLKSTPGGDEHGTLLSKITHEQNPIIDFPSDLKVPDQPQDIEPGKDLNITLIILPCLEKYETSTRYGVRSRSWPEGMEKTPHDGVSFGILGIEFVSVGPEEIRLGRTGKSRRERLRADIEARRKGLELQQQRIDKSKAERVEQLLATRKASLASRPENVAIPRSVPTSSLSNSYDTIDAAITTDSSQLT